MMLGENLNMPFSELTVYLGNGRITG
jgi:hypothetical protein